MQKTQKCFLRFFLRLRSESQILTPHHAPLPFENFLLDALNSKQKPSAKKRSIARSETGRLAGQPA